MNHTVTAAMTEQDAREHETHDGLAVHGFPPLGGAAADGVELERLGHHRQGGEARAGGEIGFAHGLDEGRRPRRGC